MRLAGARNDRGQGVVEYALLLMLAGGLVFGLSALGKTVNKEFQTVSNNIGSAGGGGGGVSLGSPPSVTQSCGGSAATVLPTLSVVLDNSQGVAAGWTANISQLLSNGTLWAAAVPATGTISAGQTATISIVPDITTCATIPPGQTLTYSASFVSGGTTLTVNDSISYA